MKRLYPILILCGVFITFGLFWLLRQPPSVQPVEPGRLAVPAEAVVQLPPEAPVMELPAEDVLPIPDVVAHRVLPEYIPVERTEIPSDVAQFILSPGDFVKRRNQAIYGLPQNLTDTDYLALCAYLLVPQPGKDVDFRQHEYALRNYIMGALSLDQDRIAETVDVFTRIAQDERQGDVLRGYALQHLAGLHLEYQGKLDPQDIQNIVQELSAFLSDRSQGTLASAALVGLQEVSRMNPEDVSPQVVKASALVLLKDDSAGAMSHISALQICAELKADEAIPFARKAAFDAQADWGLRVSAVYALGQLDKAHGLESLLNDPDKQVRTAVLAALEKGKP